MSGDARPLVVAANWKMHKTATDVGPWFAGFARSRPAPRRGVRIVLLPPFPILEAVVEAAAAGEGDVSVGAQDCHWEAEGAFTGEVSPGMVAATGAEWTLVGHSERRQLFGETDETCARKLAAVLAAGLRPLLCVGETLEEREGGRARAVVLRQLTRAVGDLARGEYERLAIAYEPVWAIGTGRTARPEDAQEMHAGIRDALASIATPELARRTPVLYGGSVKPANAGDLARMPDVDGALVGGASLDPAEFAAIVAAASEIHTG